MSGRRTITEEQRRRGEALARLIQAARRKKDRTQQELAEEADISLDTLRAIEAGRSASPSFFTVAALARALDVRLDEFARQTLGERP